MSHEYVKTLGLMSGRAPGKTCMKTLQNMALNKKPFGTPYNDRGGGCGASMRSACFGLAFTMD